MSTTHTADAYPRNSSGYPLCIFDFIIARIAFQYSIILPTPFIVAPYVEIVIEVDTLVVI